MPAPNLCVVSGTVFDENGVPAVGVTLYLKRVLLNGVLIGTAPIGTATIPGPSGENTVFYIEAITSIAGGVVSFTVPQLSTIYLEGNVSGYNNGEVALSIPATATATLEALTPATFPIDVTTFTFLSLVDTPDDFTGHGLKNVRVNAAGTALEFAAASAVVTAEEIQDALVSFFPDVAPFDWTYDDAGDRVTLAILDATSAARGLMSTAYAARLDQLEVGDAPTFAGLTLTGSMSTGAAGYGFVGGAGTAQGMSSSGTSTVIRSGAVNAAIYLQDSAGNNFLSVVGGIVGINKPSSIGAQLHTLSNAIGVIPLIAEGPAGQTANLFEARVNGAAVLNISAAGEVRWGTTSSFPMLQRSGAQVIFRLADNSNYAGMQASNVTGIGGNISSYDAGASTRYFAVGITTSGSPRLVSGGHYQWTSSATDAIGTADTSLCRQAAGVVQVGDGGANANGKVRAAEYQVAAIKVIGAQGAAVADATDNPSAITQLNLLLARLRAATGHGLIA